MITAVSVAQTAVSISTSLRAQNYSRLADEAVRAGEAYAYSCIKKSQGNYWPNTLQPQTNCLGTIGPGNSYIEQNSQYTSTFAVSPLDTSGPKPKASVTGTITLAGSLKQYVSKGVVIVNLASSDPVTTLPTSPLDGQEVYYRANRAADGTSVVWHLRYDANTTYWEFLGGTSIYTVDPNVRETSSTTWVGSSAVAYLPLNGDYDVTFGSQLMTNKANALNQMQVGLNLNASTLTACYFIAVSLYNGSSESCTFELRGVTGVAYPNTYLQVRYMSLSGQLSSFYPMFVKVTPIRVKS